MLLIPAILLMLLIYSIGMNTYLLTKDYRAGDADSAGPGMQLEHISRGFYWNSIKTTYMFGNFHSMLMSLAYVPYIWTRTGVLPPYRLDLLDKSFPSLKHELIVMMRRINLIAALGILFACYYLTWLFCKTPLPSFLVSLMVVLNPNLMFQTGSTYFESWSVFWAVLSVFFFVKCFIGTTKKFLWFSLFLVIATLAVSCHERMAGYYIFTVPFLIHNFYVWSRKDKKSAWSTVLLISASLSLSFIVYCIVNSVFISGFGPIVEFFRYKQTFVVDPDPNRYSGVLRFMDKQFRCQRYSLWLIICNLGGIVPFFSLCGLWAVCKKRFTPLLAILLFPLGYQMLSVGLPGWTCGRYIMGQTIFATLYAGFGIAWCVERAKKANKMGWFWVAITSALVSQLFLVTAVKVADNYYQPYRVIEKIIKCTSNQGKRIVIEGIDFTPGMFRENNVIYENIPENRDICPGANIIISKNGIGCNVYRKEFRAPPRWLVLLAAIRCCDLMIQFSPFVIEECANAHQAHKMEHSF